MKNNIFEKYQIAIILPAYNEEATIVKTINDFYREIPNASIWVINNCSTDSTEALAKQKINDLNCKGGVINESRKGKGNAVRRAFNDIDSDFYVLADADTTYPANQVFELLKPAVDGNADMVVGDRHIKGNYAAENKRMLHGFGNWLVKYLVNNLFSANLSDIMSGYRVFTKKFVKNYPIIVEGFEIETDMTLHALDKRYKIVEIAVEYTDRPAGSYSKLNTFKDGYRVLSTIGQILRYYRPLVFFGSFAFLFIVVSLMAGAPVIFEWLDTGYIKHIPLAILATGLAILSLLFFGIGLILESITHQEKLNYEYNLLNFKDD